MERLFGKWALWVLIILVQISGYNSCFEEERMGLLEFKAFVKSNGADADHLLPTWIDGRESESCCDWERVTCNHATGHVVELALDDVEDVEYYIDYKIRFINVSLLLPFKELQTLNLSHNNLFYNEGFEKLSSLRKLEILDLSYNNFDNNSIFHSLGALTSLKTLLLHDNNLEGYFPAHELLALRKLKVLDIGYNSYNGSLPRQGFERLSVLRKLETLSINDNEFDNSILSSLSAITSLKMLNLEGNKLEGSFPADELAHLENLEVLDLSINGLDNTSANQGCDSLSRLKKLQTLSLWYNKSNKSIIPCLSALTSLTNLNLYGNELGGFLPVEGCDSLSRLKKLQTLSLGYKFDKSIILCLSALTSLTNLNLEWSELGGFLPVEELSVLKNLKVLNLQKTGLHSMKAEDTKTLSKLTMLRHLDLSFNSFNKSILSLLGALPSLKFLSLEHNRVFDQSLEWNGMEGQLLDQELAGLSDLEVLLLGNNALNGTLPMQGLASFHHLQVLDLSGNRLIGSIPPSIGALSSLKALSLAGNELNGSLPAHQGFCELEKLQELDLSSNNFEGIIPPCLNSSTNLRLFDLSLNQFTGNVSSSLLRSLTSLEYIDLSHNRFEGLFSFSSFANHSNLEVVEFISDNKQFEIETQDSSWVPMFQLKVLVLSNCNLNKLSSHDIPNFLIHQRKLRVIDLSHNSLKGSFPTWLLENNTKLEFLSLRNNSVIGQFLLPPYRNINMYFMDVSGNHLSGQIQKNIGEMLCYISYLNVSRNTIEGIIPISFGNMSKLEQLDLSINKLSGEVLYEVVAGCTRLTILNLSANKFHGKILSSYFNLAWLEVLHLDNNCFTGTLSDLIFNSSSLFVLDISNNRLSGEIPSGIGNLTSLSTLILRNNSFEGQFPFEQVPHTSFLDLSHNSFVGSLPSWSNLNSLEHVHLQGNKFTGSIPKCFLNSSYLLTLDMRDNNLSGIIPTFVGVLSNLRVLLLGGNHFVGLIPNHLCQLSKIGMMDLSRNSFRGSIPNCFHNISFGKINDSDLTSPQTIIFGKYGHSFYEYGSVLQRNLNIHDSEDEYSEQEQVEFVTKHRSSSYKGDILNLMSGLDLSCNNLKGEIPPELGKLSSILALNLSHNHLTGPIPNTFSNLTHMESLDLSYNNLSGVIPSELIDLTFLEVFNVSHNNLSGRIPDMKAQFGTFEANSYEGNPFLCGQMIKKPCTPIVDAPYVPPANSDESDGKWYEIDPVVFSSSFSGTYVMILLGFAALLYINPYWRRRWFYFIEEFIYSFYYFVCDLFSRRSGVLCF